MFLKRQIDEGYGGIMKQRRHFDGASPELRRRAPGN